MRKTSLLIILLASLFPAFASSWNLGAEAGYALNFMSTVNTWPETSYNPGHGADAAFLAEYAFSDSLSIHTGLRYIGKSFIYRHSYGEYVTSNYLEMDHFLEIPLAIRYAYRLGDVSFFAGGGGYIGIWFLAQSFGKNTSASETFDGAEDYYSHGDIMPFDDTDNLFEAGILAETGVSVHLASSSRLDFTLRYEGNITSLVRNYQKNTAHRYDDTLSFTIGFLVPVGGER